MAYTSLYLLGRLLVVLFFGKLTAVESQHVYDRLIHYVLFKLLFVAAVLEPAVLDTAHLLAWAIWFSCLGFGHIFALLCRDRFNYVIFMVLIENR
jgi:hypothetical protein